MSRSRFAEQFRARVGQSPNQYLVDWRLTCARRLLREDRLSVAAIAETVGYRSVPSFTRRFAHRFGIGPGRYRRTWRETV